MAYEGGDLADSGSTIFEVDPAWWRAGRMTWIF